MKCDHVRGRAWRRIRAVLDRERHLVGVALIAMPGARWCSHGASPEDHCRPVSQRTANQFVGRAKSFLHSLFAGQRHRVC